MTKHELFDAIDEGIHAFKKKMEIKKVLRLTKEPKGIGLFLIGGNYPGAIMD
jgi:hypothetical protein